MNLSTDPAESESFTHSGEVEFHGHYDAKDKSITVKPVIRKDGMKITLPESTWATSTQKAVENVQGRIEVTLVPIEAGEPGFQVIDWSPIS